jgi:hypothetical protein
VTVRNPAWAELVQLIPVITLACSFLVTGDVDLARAGPLFVVSAVLAVVVSAAVVARGHTLNPVLVGTGLWLCLGAVGFGFHVLALEAWLADTRAVGLFVAAFAVGLVATFVSPAGYIGLRHSDARWVFRASLALLVLTGVAIAWAWVFRTNLRLGGGLPFIVVNVARRIAIARAGP